MKYDLSAGDPIKPFKALVNRAFRSARQTAHTYEYPNQFLRDNNSAWTFYPELTDYFTARGFKEEGYSGIGFNNVYIASGGTTGAYELIIRLLAEDVAKENKNCDRTIKPVILMPVPTYGYFFMAPEKHGIEIVKIPRDMSNSGKLDPKKVHEAIMKCRADGKRVVAYYDCSPHNPLGFVRSREETEAVARIIKFHNEQYKHEERELAPNKTRWRFDWTGPASRIRIIDDLVYDGLQYYDEPVVSYGQMPGMFEDTFMLFGVSKLGFVNGRAGLIMGASRDDLFEIHKIQKSTAYLPPMIGAHALRHYFNDQAAQKAEREAYLADVREIYRFNGIFMKALMNGLPGMEAVDEKDKRHMENLLMRHRRLTRAQAQERLNTGIAGVKVITTPRAGFFHLLDFSQLRGYQYTRNHSIGYSDPKTLKDEGDVDSALGHDLYMASGTWCGLEIEQMIRRITFALPPKVIIEVCEKLQSKMRSFSPGMPAAPATRQLILG